ncbi:Nudix family hydrolase [Aquisalimonas asiatica]|uniref:8-oxo-dGTP diphosphatase n=1 Tax=Aquisalimonas asiatica TaxID=406100 RepID=A0A1H8S7L8_9GAMM|nr:Nudix family hydrolase [Aquisalimonas asiatica]SEO74526.1 8-oxo-dGTPase [Aquisalimonas asiatica]
MSGADPEPIHVAVGVIRQPDGRVLIARRAEGSHQGGRWEYPGGKVEAGETIRDALTRELHEELGIRPLELRPLIRVPWRYADKSVLLDTWEVRRFAGTPSGREGQPLRWVPPPELARYRFPAANGPITTAAALPETYLITPDVPGGERHSAFVERLRRHMAGGAELVQLRLPGASATAWRRIAADAAQVAREQGARLLLNGDVALARELGTGVHLPAAMVRALGERPLAASSLVGASCHDARELDQAVALGADFAVLGPVRPTASHPDATPLGDAQFQALIADVPIPVYALGGLGPEDLPQLQGYRAQGIAAIRGLWREA